MTEIKKFDYLQSDIVAEYVTHYPQLEYYPDVDFRNVLVRFLFFAIEKNYEENTVTYDVLVEHLEKNAGLFHLHGFTKHSVRVNSKEFINYASSYTPEYLPHIWNDIDFYEDYNFLEYGLVGDSLPYPGYETSGRSRKWYALDRIKVKNDIFGDGEVKLDIDLLCDFTAGSSIVSTRTSRLKERTIVKLPRLNRNSYITNLKHGYFDEEITFDITKRHPTFKDRIFYKVENSDFFEIPYDDSGKCSFKLNQETMRLFPNKTSANVYIQIVTYSENGDRLNNDEDLYTRVIELNPNLKPKIATFKIENTNTDVYNLLGENVFLQNISGIRCEIVGEEATLGAKIVRREITVDDVSRSGNMAEFPPSNKIGRVFCSCLIEDSRGKVLEVKRPILYTEYKLPEIQSFLANRDVDNASSVNSIVIANATELMRNNLNVNNWSVIVEYSERGANQWTKCYEANVNVPQFNNSIFLGNQFNVTTGYDIRLSVKDKFYSQTSLVTISTMFSTMVLGRKSVGIGKSPLEYRTLDVAGITNSSGGFAIDDVPIQNWQLTQNSGLALRTETDCDLLLSSGFYYVYPAVHSPEGRALYLIVVEGKKGFYMQIAIDQRSRKIYTRSKWTGANWQSWLSIGTSADSQRFKLTRDDGTAKRGENDCNKLTQAGDYYIVGGTNTPAKINGIEALVRVVAIDSKNLTQYITAKSQTIFYHGYRVCNNGIWTDWFKLGGVDAESYPVVFMNGLKPSTYAKGINDNKVVVIDNIATLHLRVDASNTTGSMKLKIPKVAGFRAKNWQGATRKNAEIDWAKAGYSTLVSGESVGDPNADALTFVFESETDIRLTGGYGASGKKDLVGYATWYVGGGS